MLEEKIKNIIKEFLQFLKNPKELIKFLFPILIVIGLLYPVPYYIKLGGGTIPLNDKIKIEQEEKESGSFNAIYVSEMKGNVLFYLLSFVVPSFEKVKEEKVTLENETSKEYNYREKLYFTSSTDAATKVAYQKAGKKVYVKSNHLVVLYIDKNSKTELKVKDEIISIEGNRIKEFSDIENIVKEKKKNDEITILVKRNNKKVITKSKIIEIDGAPKLGIAISNILDYGADPKVNFSFDESQTGPSGGLMIALTIYDKLIEKDLTGGKKIMGTGTINENGEIGEVGGIKYKLKGASKKGADLVFVSEKNYNEAIREKNKNNYNFEIYKVKTFDDAVNKLENR